MTLPLLKLCMIVKDEVAGIAKTLESVRPHIDRWLILDTGSTDGTQALVRTVMAEVPGELHEAPFVDFATTRNAVMDLAGTDCEYILWLDAEDCLHGGDNLRRFLEQGPQAALADGFFLTMRMASNAFRSIRLVRSRAGWRYRGVVHEVLMAPEGHGSRQLIPDVAITHERQQESAERTRARWERDRELLFQAIAQNPLDTRATFYLAQTYRCLGMIPEAIATYRRRVELGGWQEEVYCSLMAIADMSSTVGIQWPEVQQLYLEAHAMAPHRAEPLCAIADHYVKEQAYALGYVFALRAYEIPYPEQDILFVDAGTYTWRAADLLATTAYYVGAFALGAKAARQALAASPDNPRLQANLRFYEQNPHPAAPPTRREASAIPPAADVTPTGTSAAVATTTLPELPPPEAGTHAARLHLGCGADVRPGWINVDSQPRPGLQIVADLNDVRRQKLPLDDDSIDYILGAHVIEHIPNSLDLMQELHRVAKPGALAEFLVPYGSSDDTWEDPTHVRPYFLNSFMYFAQPAYYRADYGYRGDWFCRRLLVTVKADYRGWDRAAILEAINTKRNVVAEMKAELVAVKPIRPNDRALLRHPVIDIVTL